jgi:hypothetical protein
MVEEAARGAALDDMGGGYPRKFDLAERGIHKKQAAAGERHSGSHRHLSGGGYWRPSHSKGPFGRWVH